MADTDCTTSILTLGDGDFTYSLDLAHYIAGSIKANVQLVATGIDTKAELLSKYKDSPHILDQLDAAAKSPRLSISVKHGINAIILDTTDHDGIQSAGIGKVDHVIFNHPHLGTEDAALHGRFLSHFFHSCVHRWLNPKRGALVYLTLVDGQYERWNCEQAAKRQGLILLQRAPFTSPPVMNPSYHYRRHQTGKSFESRRPSGSETFVFAQEKDRDVDVSTSILSWQTMPSRNVAPTTGGSEANQPQPSPPTALSCPYCDRVFKEERSRTCHLRAKHPNGPEKKTRLIQNPNSFECILCKNKTGEARSFESEQALQDHARAKHSAIHKTILPDWCPGIQNPSGPKETIKDVAISSTSTCEVCAATFVSMDKHMDEFKPSTSGEKFSCQFCKKWFREERAKRQHENFCKERQ